MTPSRAVGSDEYEIDGGEEEMILAREVNVDGRNTCRVNGRIVPLRLLSTLAERLVDIHGQSLKWTPSSGQR